MRDTIIVSINFYCLATSAVTERKLDVDAPSPKEFKREEIRWMERLSAML